MSFVRNNQEYLLLFVVVIVAFTMAAGLGIAFRGGNPPLITSFHSFVALFHF